MANIILHQIHGICVGIQPESGFINATKTCEAYRLSSGKVKRPSHWLETQRAKDYIAYVSSVTDIPVTDLVNVNYSAERQKSKAHGSILT